MALTSSPTQGITPLHPIGDRPRWMPRHAAVFTRLSTHLQTSFTRLCDTGCAAKTGAATCCSGDEDSGMGLGGGAMDRKSSMERVARRQGYARFVVGLALLLALTGARAYLWVTGPFVFWQP